MGRVIVVAAVALVACGGKAVIDRDDEPKGGGGASSASSTTTTTSAAGGAGGSFVCPRCGDPEQVGAVGSPELDEVSGIASPDARTLYVHNDSGDSARFFRLDASGALLTTYELSGAAAVDWEDMALGPCGLSGRCIYLADIGDNAERRNSYAIYRVPAPIVVETGTHTIGFDTLPFVYPDGSHNAETLWIDPLDGTPCVVTKVQIGASAVYCYPGPQQPDVLVTLELRATIEPPIGVPMLTAGDYSTKGALLRSYTNVFFWQPGLSVEDELADPPCILPSPPDQQGEAIGWLADGSGFVTVSEGVGSPIYRVPCSF